MSLLLFNNNIYSILQKDILMIEVFLLFLLFSCGVALNLSFQRNKNLVLHPYTNIRPSCRLFVGDFATEIENAVGSEIYGPIFRAGLFLFVRSVTYCFGV